MAKKPAPVLQTAPEEAPVDVPPIKADNPILALLKDAAFWAVLTLLLLTPVAGFKTFARGGRYQFDNNMDVVLGIAVFVFLGRILLNLTIWRKPKTATARAASGTVFDKRWAQTARKFLVPAMLMLAVTYPFLSIWA